MTVLIESSALPSVARAYWGKEKEKEGAGTTSHADVNRYGETTLLDPRQDGWV